LRKKRIATSKMEKTRATAKPNEKSRGNQKNLQWAESDSIRKQGERSVAEKRGVNGRKGTLQKFQNEWWCAGKLPGRRDASDDGQEEGRADYSQNKNGARVLQEAIEHAAKSPKINLVDEEGDYHKNHFQNGGKRFRTSSAISGKRTS